MPVSHSQLSEEAEVGMVGSGTGRRGRMSRKGLKRDLRPRHRSYSKHNASSSPNSVGSSVRSFSL